MWVQAKNFILKTCWYSAHSVSTEWADINATHTISFHVTTLRSGFVWRYFSPPRRAFLPRAVCHNNLNPVSLSVLVSVWKLCVCLFHWVSFVPWLKYLQQWYSVHDLWSLCSSPSFNWYFAWQWILIISKIKKRKKTATLLIHKMAVQATLDLH